MDDLDDNVADLGEPSSALTPVVIDNADENDIDEETMWVLLHFVWIGNKTTTLFYNLNSCFTNNVRNI